MMGTRSVEERRLLSKSVEPDYGDEEVHLSPESIIGPDTTFRYLDKRENPGARLGRMGMRAI